jgi:hypothetical protein
MALASQEPRVFLGQMSSSDSSLDFHPPLRKISDITRWFVRWSFLESDYLTFPEGTDLQISTRYADLIYEYTETFPRLPELSWLPKEMKKIYGEEFWDKLKNPRVTFLCHSILLSAATKLSVQIPNLSNYVLKIDAPSGAYLKLGGRAEKFSTEGSFPLHPYYPVFVRFPEGGGEGEKIVKVTFVCINKSVETTFFRAQSFLSRVK